MSADPCLLALATKLQGKLEPDAIPIAAATFTQFMLGYALYGLLFAAPWQRNMSIDKGIKKIELMKTRHNMLFCLLGSVIANLVRACAVLLVVDAIAAPATLCAYMSAASLVFAVEFCGVAHYFWSQKPMALLFIDQVSNVSCGALAAATLFYFKN